MIALLVLANAGFYAWSNGHLAGLGLAPANQQEPERLTSQIKPELMRLLNAPATAEQVAANSPEARPGALETAGTPANTETTLPPTACWLVKGFTTAQTTPLETRMLELALPKGSWRIEQERASGRWVVYMGRYSDELLGRKKEELRELKVEFRTLTAPPLGPGLALGTYSSEAAAEQGLKDVVRKGVRSARVEQERNEAVSHTLRLAEVTEEERTAVEGLGSALLAGKRFQPCRE
ncbi:MAG: SPOR domain-containing protein [Hydrogenophaga sp.]